MTKKDIEKIQRCLFDIERVMHVVEIDRHSELSKAFQRNVNIIRGILHDEDNSPKVSER